MSSYHLEGELITCIIVLIFSIVSTFLTNYLLGVLITFKIMVYTNASVKKYKLTVSTKVLWIILVGLLRYGSILNGFNCKRSLPIRKKDLSKYKKFLNQAQPKLHFLLAIIKKYQILTSSFSSRKIFINFYISFL